MHRPKTISTTDTSSPPVQPSSAQFGVFLLANLMQAPLSLNRVLRSIHHDPETYPDPDSFNPNRFLDENGKEKNTEESRILGHHLYGFGRRFVSSLLSFFFCPPVQVC